MHFPPVIERLFSSRYDPVENRIRHPRFSFAEVLRAVKDTGVELTWIRADTFLAEIARSRNVKKLLAPCLDRGYTIRKCIIGEAIGEFVPLGHEGGLEMKAPVKSKKGAMRGQPTIFG